MQDVGWNPVINATLVGNIDNGNTQTTDRDTTHLCSEFQVKMGNKCGHRKNDPLICPPTPTHKRRPPVIEQAKKRIQEAYHHPEKYDFGKLSHHQTIKTKHGYKRLIRSERRDLIHNVVMQSLFHYIDLKALRFGWWDNRANKFINLSINFLHKDANAGMKRIDPSIEISEKRVRKALNLLEDAGYIVIQENKKMTIAGKYYSLPAILHINPSLFYDLGFTDQDIKRSIQQELLPFQRYYLQQKSKEYKKKSREEIKQDKANSKKAREIINKLNLGHKLTAEEKIIADKECPGHDRKREASGAYRDYTGCSTNKNILQEPDNVSDVGKAHLSGMLRMLAGKMKPPP